MKFNLIPKEEKFFDMFDDMVTIMSRASVKLHDMIIHMDNLAAREKEIKEEEHGADLVVERIIKALDQSFITPFDREDIHSLAAKLDNVLDFMEEGSCRFAMFKIEKPTEPMISMARIIQECCGHLEKAVRLCRSFDNADQIQLHLREIHRLEEETDRIYRDAETALFANPPDVLTLIKLREIYLWLENTTDACKTASVIVSEIIVKGA